MQESFDVTTIIFLALAVFVIWRLRSVLGQKTGHERPPLDFSGQSSQSSRTMRDDNVVRLPGSAAPVSDAPPPPGNAWKGVTQAGTPIAQTFEAMAKIEPAFNGREFLEGAKAAYEMIVTAYAAGDRKTLKDLLSKDVYEGFESAIAEREKRGEKVDMTFVSNDKADITAADLKVKTAHVTVRFLSKLITATRDASGKVIDGDAQAVVDVTDVWTFSRTLGSRDPTWQLVATEAGA